MDIHPTVKKVNKNRLLKTTTGHYRRIGNVWIRKLLLVDAFNHLAAKAESQKVSRRNLCTVKAPEGSEDDKPCRTLVSHASKAIQWTGRADVLFWNILEPHTFFMFFFFSSLFQVKKKQNCGMWTIFIRLKGQGGNLLTRLGLVSRLPQVSQAQRVETGGRKGEYIEKETTTAQCHPC